MSSLQGRFAIIEQLLADGAGAIGVGVPMNIDRRTGIAQRAVNLPLESLDLARRLRERFDIPVGLENDGNAIALAEWRLGAGRGVTDLVVPDDSGALGLVADAPPGTYFARLRAVNACGTGAPSAERVIVVP